MAAEKLTAAEFQALTGKCKGKPPAKKVQSAAEQMDIAELPAHAALMAVTINRLAEYVDYNEDKGNIEFVFKGRRWRVNLVEVT